jgi:small subunit ribosomal protein S21
MIIVKIKDGQSLDKALKHLKRKFNAIGVLDELRDRQQFTKPSMKRRNIVKKAKYVQKIRAEEDKNE